MTGQLTGALARFAATFPGAGVPSTARRAASRCLLDTLACAVAGLAEESSRILLDLTASEAPAGPCTAIGLDRRVAAREAALVNGSLAHALDFDDTHDLAVLHPGVAVIPAALATAERVGTSGQALLDAIVVGYDVHIRVALAATAAPGHSGWHYTSACGIFGAAAAAGRLLGLDENGMARAFGLALPQAAGTLQSEHDGTWAKRLQPGLAAAGGVLAAQLAARGFLGAREPLEGRFGFYRVYLREFDPAPVLDALGHRFEIEGTSLKPLPTCRFTHAPAAALQEVMREHQLQGADLEVIEARVTAAALAEVCEPLSDKVEPKTRVHAQFSLPYALACVAHHGTVRLEDLTEEGIRREEVLALAQRVQCLRDPGLEVRWGEKIGEAEVRVRTRNGATVVARALPPGGPERPMSASERVAKARECVAWGAPHFDAGQLAAEIDALRHSTSISNLSRCLRLVGGPPSGR